MSPSNLQRESLPVEQSFNHGPVSENAIHFEPIVNQQPTLRPSGYVPVAHTTTPSAISNPSRRDFHDANAGTRPEVARQRPANTGLSSAPSFAGQEPLNADMNLFPIVSDAFLMELWDAQSARFQMSGSFNQPNLLLPPSHLSTVPRNMPSMLGGGGGVGAGPSVSPTPPGNEAASTPSHHRKLYSSKTVSSARKVSFAEPLSSTQFYEVASPYLPMGPHVSHDNAFEDDPMPMMPNYHAGSYYAQPGMGQQNQGGAYSSQMNVDDAGSLVTARGEQSFMQFLLQFMD
ncbi:hypothetical protein HDU98_007060 [Podochytrium sp. JEL0797]|nr:hypothetical protein HDU98_007060 [Podochytrium sp. JEL0797]